MKSHELGVISILALTTVIQLAGCEPRNTPLEPTREVDDKPSQAAAVVTHQVVREPFVFPPDPTLINPCTGEATPMTGEFLFHFTRVELPNGGFHVEAGFNGVATGTGVTSGATYRAHDVQHLSFNTNGRLPSTDTFIAQLSVNSPGPDNNFSLRTRFHVTTTANGEITVSRDEVTLECR
jgi:hypothetical protein